MDKPDAGISYKNNLDNLEELSVAFLSAFFLWTYMCITCGWAVE